MSKPSAAAPSEGIRPVGLVRPVCRPPIALLGVPFDNLTIAEAIERIEQMIASGRPHYLVTANVDFLVQARTDVELRRILFDAHLVLCDGTPLVWASRLLGNPLPERVAGADLAPLLIRVAAEKQYRLFLLGATPESAGQAVARLRAQHPALLIAGHYSPPFNRLLEMDHDEIKGRIVTAQPDLLFVSFGCPKQEKWMAMHYRELGVPVVAGVGATIDFLAGQVRRAPPWMRRFGIEWLFRLAQEPRRLYRRYFKDLWVFGWALLAQWWQLALFRHVRLRANSSSSSSFSSSSSKSHEESSTSTIQGEVCGGGAAFKPLDAPAQQPRKPDWQCLRLPARLDLAAVRESAPLAEQVLSDARPCVLDLANTTFIDSTGIGLLIRLQKETRAAGRHLVLLAPSPVVRRALALMRLEDFFAVASDYATAEQLLAARVREQAAAVTVGKAAAAPLSWRGEITAANAAEVWKHTEAHLATLPPGSPWLIDLSQLRFIDSTGLGLMVRARKLARQQQKTLTFAGLQPAVRNVLRLARLEEFLS